MVKGFLGSRLGEWVKDVKFEGIKRTRTCKIQWKVVCTGACKMQAPNLLELWSKR